MVSKPYSFVQGIISLLEQHNTPMLSLHLEEEVTILLFSAHFTTLNILPYAYMCPAEHTDLIPVFFPFYFSFYPAIQTVNVPPKNLNKYYLHLHHTVSAATICILTLCIPQWKMNWSIPVECCILSDDLHFINATLLRLGYSFIFITLHTTVIYMLTSCSSCMPWMRYTIKDWFVSNFICPFSYGLIWLKSLTGVDIFLYNAYSQ